MLGLTSKLLDESTAIPKDFRCQKSDHTQEKVHTQEKENKQNICQQRKRELAKILQHIAN